jgi:hypothetical protein
VGMQELELMKVKLEKQLSVIKTYFFYFNIVT